ncbi:MAG: hypothetical protein SVN78_07490 [Deferribacterota bacterium]|nr:hypothetical protein [Deferribacterota bacterium]
MSLYEYIKKLEKLEKTKKNYEIRGLDLVNKETGNIVLKYRKVYINKINRETISIPKKYNNFFELVTKNNKLTLKLKKLD